MIHNTAMTVGCIFAQAQVSDDYHIITQFGFDRTGGILDHIVITICMGAGLVLFLWQSKKYHSRNTHLSQFPCLIYHTFESLPPDTGHGSNWLGLYQVLINKQWCYQVIY